MRDLSDIVLIYTSSSGTEFEQPLGDITSAGTLIDPESGDDLELAGWRFNTTSSDSALPLTDAERDSVVLFAERFSTAKPDGTADDAVVPAPVQSIPEKPEG